MNFKKNWELPLTLILVFGVLAPANLHLYNWFFSGFFISVVWLALVLTYGFNNEQRNNTSDIEKEEQMDVGERSLSIQEEIQESSE